MTYLGKYCKKLSRESESDFQITPKYSQGCLGQDNALLFQKRKYVLCSVNLNTVKDIHHNCVPNQPCQDKVRSENNSLLEQSSVKYTGACSTLTIISMLM